MLPLTRSLSRIHFLSAIKFHLYLLETEALYMHTMLRPFLSSTPHSATVPDLLEVLSQQYYVVI